MTSDAPRSQRLSRRKFLGLGAAGTAALLLDPVRVLAQSPSPTAGNPPFGAYPFSLGVASGDPLPNSVVLWTRLAPDLLAPDGGMPSRKVPVQWEVAADDRFRRVVERGTDLTTPELGHSVHAEVYGLEPGREYFYRFKAASEISPIGRTKTAPAAGAIPEQLRFAFASCQAFSGGRYAAYIDMASQDLDLVVHVGDYIYELADTSTLADFRLLHAQYKSSPDLQAAHAAFPFVVTFDDHEIDNNWADEIPQDDTPNFMELRANAFQAYYEHMPLRSNAKPVGPDMLLHRRLAYGKLAEFNVLDTRQYRDDQLNDEFPGGLQDSGVFEPSRTFLGPDQEQWLLDNLDRSTARWNILAQQTIMAQYDYDVSDAVRVNHDQWDGYAAARDRVLGFIQQRQPSNPVVITGDWHCSWVNDLKADFNDPGSATVATEFVGTSIASACPWAPNVASALEANPHVKFFDGDNRGYVLCTVTPDGWRSDYRVVPHDQRADPNAPVTTLTSWVVEDGVPGAQPLS